MRAMVAAAEAQIKQADYALRAAETKVTLDVQDLYQRLAYYSALRDRHERLQKHREKFVDMANATMLQKVPAAVDNAYSAAADVFDATMRVERLRGELAAICGLRNPDRIAVPKTFTQRYIDADKLELDWLIQMAGIYRSDLQQLHARYDAARAEYRAERAKEIPALLSIDVGWERQWDGFGRHDKDEFVVRGIFSLPLWSWLINDEKEIPAAEARNYSRQIGRMNNRIVAEVDAALRGLRAAQRMLAKYEQHRAGVNLMAKNAGLAIASSDKPQELMSEAQEIGMKLDIGELEVRRHYNERLLDLEKALGTRLDSLLRQGNP
jgi:outer membrane protein TolC